MGFAEHCLIVGHHIAEIFIPIEAWLDYGEG